MENWKPIAGFEGLYSISSHGRVMRTGSGGAAQPGKILANAIDQQGYVRIKLCRNYTASTRKVHRLVAEAFIGSIPIGYTINHIDGIKSNNRVDNLEIVTRGQNISHAFRVLGSQSNVGADNPRAKLTSDQVLDIRRRLLQGESPNSLADEFFVTKHTISNIKVRKTWTHI